MKACVTALCILFLSITVKAEMSEADFSSPGGVSQQSVPEVNSSSSLTQGFRMALLKPVLNLKMKVSVEGYGSASDTEKLDSATGVPVGYAFLPIQKAGFTTNFAVINVKEEGDDSISLLRADGNLAFAVNPNVNFKGGFNLSTFNKSEIRKEFTPGFGLQASVGFQLNKNLGVDVAYVTMNQQRKTIDGVSGSLEESGPELALTGTF